MSHPAMPWLIGGGAALAAILYANSQSTPQIIAPPPLVDPNWAKKYSVDPRLLAADMLYAKQGIDTLKPGQQMVLPTNLQVTADVGPNRTITATAQQVSAQIQKQAAFTAKWGIKEVWAATELIELLDKNPAAAKFLFRFPIANDRQAQEMDAMMSGRVTIIIDTVEALQYFSGVLLLAMMGSFDVAKGTINLDKPVIKNLMRLFSYHNWQVAEDLAEYQLDTLNRFVGAPVDRWLRNPDGENDDSEIKYYHASGPYWSPEEKNWNAGQWYRCVPNEYPGMNVPGSPTANPDYYMKAKVDNGDNFRRVEVKPPYGNGAYWTKNVSSQIVEGWLKDHLGDARPFAKKILGNGRLWLFEYAALRLQNITYASSMIKGVSDLAGQALGALLKAVQGLVMLAAGAPGGEKLLMDAIGTALKTLIAFILDAIKAEEDNEKVQRSVESHLNMLLATFWSTSLQTMHTSSYLSGYQLGVIPNFQEGMLHAGYRTGASRSVSYLMRNFVMVHDQAVGGVCAYMHLPQIPLFVRGVPFAVITSATREHLYAIEAVYGYILPPRLRQIYQDPAIAQQSGLRIPFDAKGPVGVRVISIHRGAGVVKVEHGPGAGGPTMPFHQYVPGFGLPGKIVSQTQGGREAIL